MEQKLPLVSIAIPNYNYGRYLKNCLESVLNQTYPNIEVIFNDNASTDDSYEIALSYRKKFLEKNIFFHIGRNKRNMGSEVNSRICLQYMEGKYTYFLASDDAVEPTFIERCVNVFETYPSVNCVMTHRKEIDENGKVRETPPFYRTSCVVKAEEQLAVFMMAGIAIPSQCMRRRTTTLKQNKHLRNCQVAGDWMNNFFFALSGDVAYIKDPLCFYRVHSSNETSESERNMLAVMEHYTLVNYYAELADIFGYKKAAGRREEAIKKLGGMCVRYAEHMVRERRYATAKRYMELAAVFDEDIINDPTYQEYGREIGRLLRGEESSGTFASAYSGRTVSYDPPEHSIELEGA